jgi:hypothetical protein
MLAWRSSDRNRSSERDPMPSLRHAFSRTDIERKKGSKPMLRALITSLDV